MMDHETCFQEEQTCKNKVIGNVPSTLPNSDFHKLLEWKLGYSVSTYRKNFIVLPGEHQRQEKNFQKWVIFNKHVYTKPLVCLVCVSCEFHSFHKLFASV